MSASRARTFATHCEAFASFPSRHWISGTRSNRRLSHGKDSEIPSGIGAQIEYFLKTLRAWRRGDAQGAVNPKP